MTNCESYQDQLLAYLYDLLEPAERQGLEAHLEQCAPCRAALGRARNQQSLLAAAAKREFPNVRFQPPQAEPFHEEPSIRFERPARRAWRRWAIAAGILLLCSLGIPTGLWSASYVQTRLAAERAASKQAMASAELQRLGQEHRTAMEQAREGVQVVERQIQDFEQKEQAKWAALEQQARDRQLDVVLSGPQTVQAGAPNNFEVRTQNLNGNVVVANFEARVRNERNEIVFEKKDTCNGLYRLGLPLDLPLKPGSKLALEVVAQREGSDKSEVREELALVAPIYLTHLTTDKAMYQPGETVHFRSLTLERFSLRPADEDFRLGYTILSPNGEKLFQLDGAPKLFAPNSQSPLLGPDNKPIQGIGAGDFTIPPTANGGEYTLIVSEGHNRFPEQKRKFIVNKYEKPRLNKELDFTRKSYGPGDEVVAACKVARVEGGKPVANQPVTATIFIDGKPYGPDGKEGAQPLSRRTDANGAVNVHFKLPTAIERGQASLSVVFFDNNLPETLVRPIPIVVKKLQLEFSPEGGDLVAGVPNRVYFQVRTMLDKPAELKGRIVDSDGKTVVDDVHTLNDDKEPGTNQGMGLFAFTPREGGKYELKVDAPTGIEGKYPLPEVKAEGVVLSIPAGVTQPRDPIRVGLQSPKTGRTLLVGAYCRGRLMDHQTVIVPAGETVHVELRPGREVGGVYRVTVFEEQAAKDNHRQLKPLAERLVYRKPAEQLLLKIKPNMKQYIPGEHVTCTVTALNEMEKPAPSILLFAVVDKSVVTMADEKTYRTMPTHYFLTTEVRRPEDLEYADFLLGTHPKAAAALDLLLGTQGWRRFAEQNPQGFPAKFKDDAERQDAQRLLVLNGQAGHKIVPLGQHEAQRLQTEYSTGLKQLREQQDQANKALVAVQNSPDFANQMTALRSQIQEADRARGDALHRLDTQRDQGLQVATYVFPVLAVLLVVLTVYSLVVAIRRSLPGGLPYYATATVCAGIVAGVISFFPWDRLHQGLAQKPNDGDWEVAFAHPDTAVKTRALALGEAKGLPEEAPPPPGPGGFGGGRGGAARFKMEPARPMAKEADMPAPAAAAENRAFRGAVQMMGDVKKDGKEGERLLQLRNAAPEALRALAENANLAKFQDKAEPQPDHFLRFAGKDAQLEQKQNQDQAARGRMLGGLERAAAPEQQLDRFGGVQAPRGALKPLAGAAGRRGMEREMMPQAMGRQLGTMDLEKAKKRPFGYLAENLTEPPAPPLVVREYAHQRVTAAPNGDRMDFAETLCWRPVLVLPNGEAKVEFDLCDSVTTFQMTAFGHTLDGRLGAVSSTIESRLPFTLEPKLPIEVTASDKIDLAVSVANNTNEQRPVTIDLAPTGLKLDGPNKQQLTLGAESRTRRLFRLQPTLVEGSASLRIEGTSDPFRDPITRTLSVVPDGFPVVGSKSDILEGVARDEITLPESWVKGTLKCQVSVYPSTLADLQKGLEALLREPGGCFEQTSSSNYPNVLILSYLKESDQAKPEIERQALDKLARGYQILTSFECLDPGQNNRKGYEWFGGTAPPHEALTAYGLLEFRDMARVYKVDPVMVERTRNYLMSRKDGKGGFQRNPRAIDTFGRAPEEITNAYIVWALTEGGKEDDVTQELAALAEQAKTSTDPYFLALVANSLINRDQAEAGVALLKKIAELQKEDGHLDAARTSITGSGGRDLQIETTALAVLGWLKANRPAEFNVPLQKAVKWIGQQRGGYGGFGSTQSTILALKALIAFTKANKKTPEGGNFRLLVGDQPAGSVAFAADVQDALVLNLAEPEKHLKPGKNVLRVEMTGKNAFPYTLTWSYQTLKPASAEKCPVRLSTKLDRNAANEGDTVHLSVTVQNAEDKGQGMAVAIIGLPAGLTLPEDMKQLKDHARLRNEGKEKGLIGAWETRGREVILYWRDLEPKQKIEVPLDLICRVPGEYRGPASRAYLYYNADQKHWVDPLQVTIKAKAE
jgi:hypothetical protein